jgi:hypothetical protein
MGVVGVSTADVKQQHQLEQQLARRRKAERSPWTPAPLAESEQAAAAAVSSAKAAICAPGLLDSTQAAQSEVAWRKHLATCEHHLRALLLSAKHHARAAAMHFSPASNINAHASLVHCWYNGCDLGANSVGALLTHIAHMHNKEVALMDWEGIEVRLLMVN